MTTFIKLGGCNGSGKTTIAREVLRLGQCEAAPIKGIGNKPVNCYVGDWQGRSLVVLGSYDTTCGGMDTISDKNDRLDLLRAAHKRHKGSLVFFEGLITGKTYGAIGEMSEEHLRKGSATWLYAFMDTPFEVCAERVLKRRIEAGNENDFDPERTMRSTFTACQYLYEKMIGQRGGRTEVHPHPTHLIKHDKKAAAEARRLLKAAEKL